MIRRSARAFFVGPLESFNMPQTSVFRLPQRQMKWCLAVFISQLVMINFAFAGNPNFLGTLGFRLFWLLPILRASGLIQPA